MASELEPGKRLIFLENFSLPVVTKSTVTSRRLPLLTPLVAHAVRGGALLNQSYTYLMVVRFDWYGGGYLCKHDITKYS